HDRSQGVRDTRPSVNEVADEDGSSSFRMAPSFIPVSAVSKLLSKLLEFVATPMHVSDNVERTALRFAVVPHRLALKDRRVDLVLRLQDLNVSESVSPEPSQ